MEVDSDLDQDRYGDGHRLFLQSIMSRGIMHVSDVKKVLSECGVDTETGFKEKVLLFMRMINQRIAPINLEIRKGVEEEDGENYYVLANTVETPISRLSSTYSPNELELFKKLVESIVGNGDGKIGSLAAINLTDKLEKRMGKEEAQMFFNRLEDDKWIRKNSDGKISLSVRSIVELEQYIKEVYPDYIKSCDLCTKLCLQGRQCENCGARFHFRCLRIMFSKQGNEKRCPERTCAAPWGQILLN
ncbi:non-structural maintenance of chromosomes element 1-like protein [Plakobranchus ocellatus]|uniref:Non-structural maintenance of chromosomes element 1 homolog n=1 Tax=Plakobranchus ocellatus TaxID=259542 RepID=A0AAV4A4P1_9GAST|nr:non-structural maintenance of chromosomes element 1-like protein [Plakobranchus ocellatus]